MEKPRAQRILVVDDEKLMRMVIVEALNGYEILEAESGVSAWEILQKDNAPELILIDWMMPEMDGIEVIRLLRAKETRKLAHIILITSRSQKSDIVEGLQAGANDYISKPFNVKELQARVTIGAETVRLRSELAGRVAELEEAMGRIMKLEKLLPICSYCKKIRDGKDEWQQLETYITNRSAISFSHGVCPECYKTILEPQIQAMENSDAAAEILKGII
jgi:phosphoserine phosphatase RsbU/P